DESPAGWDHFFRDLLGRSQPFDLGEAGRRFRGIATQVGDGRSEREQLRQRLGLLERAGGLETALRPSPGLLGTPPLPGGLRGEENPGNRLFGLALLFEDPDRGFRLAERAVRVAGHPMRLRQQEPRVAFERAVAVPLLVLQVLERRFRRAAGVVRTEGVERLARELQTVLDGLFRNV